MIPDVVSGSDVVTTMDLVPGLGLVSLIIGAKDSE